VERHFIALLEDVREQLLKMSSLVESNVSLSLKAFMEANSEIAQTVIQNDKEINLLEVEIDDKCMSFLALQAPQACDLRFIGAALKINNNLERMGDLAVNIAERTVDFLKTRTVVKPPLNTKEMAVATQKMLKDTMDAFVRKDAAQAREICASDDVIDDLNHKLFHELLEIMREKSTHTEKALEILLIVKNLEKIADHATNICEEIIYMVEGKVIKHHLAD